MSRVALNITKRVPLQIFLEHRPPDFPAQAADFAEAHCTEDFEELVTPGGGQVFETLHAPGNGEIFRELDVGLAGVDKISVEADLQGNEEGSV